MAHLPLPLFVGGIGLQEILIILLILLVLFGGKKIPELARGLGRGITEFKRGVHEPPKKDLDEIPDQTDRETPKDI